MRRRIARLLLFLFVLLSLSGCWDARELNQLALVMAVGIDRDPDTNRYIVTIQVARPASSRGQQSGGGGAEPVYTASADGDTLFTAIRNLAQFTSRRIMWAHNNIVVIGESVAKHDITPVVDFFTRNQELRMRTWVVVARDTTAKAIITAKTGMEDIPANSLSAVLRYAALPGETLRTDMNELMDTFLSNDQHPVISGVQLRPGDASPGAGGGTGPTPQVELRGTAIFNGTRLVGYLESDQGRGLVWLRKEMKNAVVAVPCPETDVPLGITVELRSPKIRLRPTFEGSTPVIQVRVETEGWLSERDCPFGAANVSGVKEKISGWVEDDIRQSIEATLSSLQKEFKTDAVKYGSYFHSEYPDWWAANRERWSELFPQVKTRIQVSVHISKMGLFVRPPMPTFPQ